MIKPSGLAAEEVGYPGERGGPAGELVGVADAALEVRQQLVADDAPLRYLAGEVSEDERRAEDGRHRLRLPGAHLELLVEGWVAGGRTTVAEQRTPQLGEG